MLADFIGRQRSRVNGYFVNSPLEAELPVAAAGNPYGAVGRRWGGFSGKLGLGAAIEVHGCLRTVAHQRHVMPAFARYPVAQRHVGRAGVSLLKVVARVEYQLLN